MNQQSTPLIGGQASFLLTVPKRTYTEDVAEIQRRISEHERRNPFSTMIKVGLLTLALAGVFMVSWLTAYAFRLFLDQEIPPFGLKFGHLYQSDLVPGMLMFWVEVLAIVLGLKLVEKGLAWLETQQDLYALEKQLVGLISRIDDAREELHANLTKLTVFRAAAADYFDQFQASITSARDDFAEEVYCHGDLRPVAGQLFAESLVEADRYVFNCRATTDSLKAPDLWGRDHHRVFGRIDQFMKASYAVELERRIRLCDRIRRRLPLW